VLLTRKIGELYRQKGDLPDALAFFEHAHELANRADPNKALESGATALDVALKSENTDIAELLRKAGGKSGKSVTIQIK